MASSRTRHIWLKCTIARLGLVGRLMRNAPTFGAAVRDLVTHHHRYIRGSIVYLLVQGDMACWGYAVYQPGTPAIDHMCDGSMASGFNFVRELSGAPPDQILISHAAPSDIGPYRHYYGIAPRYDAEQYALVFPRQPARCSRSSPDPNPPSLFLRPERSARRCRGGKPRRSPASI